MSYTSGYYSVPIIRPLDFDFLSSGLVMSFDRNGYYESEQRLRPELESFRKTEDPILEMENAKEELEKLIRAEKLMKDVLGEGRYKDFITLGSMTIQSKLYHNRYYIIREYGYVQVIENGRHIEDLCLVPKNYRVVTQDVVALKKLMLEADEKEFLKIANHFSKESPIMEPRTAFIRQLRERFGIH